ncbi:MAG: MFS transporter [Planctomycetota bacterium]|nr:MFS transporter [Planctomycetota bacterium]
MSPVKTTITSITRVLTSFLPRSIPTMARGHYSREAVAWACLSLGVAAVEGGVTGVIAKYLFEGVVSPRMLNLTVAILAGAPAFANIISFFWAGLSQGRDKIRFLVVMQSLAMLFIILIAFAPRSPVGLMLMTLGAVGARLCWSGVVTLRSTVWQANYPREIRAKMAGKITTIQTILITLTSLSIGLAIDLHDDAFRILYPFISFIGLIGAWVYKGMRVRRHKALLLAENAHGLDGRSRVNPLIFHRILIEDTNFRRYMTNMFIFGSGNLMIMAPMVIVLKEQFSLSPLTSVLITSTIPFMLMPFSIPIWSRLLDKVHIIEFRAYHGWSFVLANAFMLTASVFHLTWLLWFSAILRGIAFGGGILGWNLGHHDFAPVEKASQYMGVHVTLTGIRGMLVPIIGVCIYEILEWTHPGWGVWVFAPCLILSIMGAIGFLRMRRTLSGPGHNSSFTDGPPIQPPAAV